MAITTMFNGYKRFCKCMILFNLRYKQAVFKVREPFEFKTFKVLLQRVNKMMESLSNEEEVLVLLLFLEYNIL